MHNSAEYIRKCWYSDALVLISGVVIQLVVQAAAINQPGMITLFHHAAVFKHQNPVGLLHRREPVGNDQRGAAGQKPGQRLMQLPLGGGVQRRGGLVQDDDPRVGHNHARNRQPLPLPAGQAHALPPHFGIQPVRQRGDRLLQLGNVQRLPQRGVIGIAPQRQVGAHAVVEQDRVLQHHADMLAHRFPADFADRHAAILNLPGFHRIQAQQGLHQRRLAAAGGAHQRHLLARRHREADIVQHRLAVCVGKTHPIERDADGGLVREGIAQCRVLRFAVQPEQGIDPPQRRIGGKPAVLHVHQFLHRRHHEPQVAKHRQHLADAEIGEHHHQHRPGAKGIEADQKHKEGNPAHRVRLPGKRRRMPADVARLGRHPCQIMLFAIHRTNLRQGIQRFGQRVLKHLERTVLVLFQLLHPLAEPGRKQDDHRVQQQDEQRQLPVHPEQHRRHAHQRQHRHDQPGDG